MEKMPTSSVDEAGGQDTAPSKRSVKKTQPETATEQPEGPVYLLDELSKLPDLDLVKIGLSALAVLHQRATEGGEEKDTDGA